MEMLDADSLFHQTTSDAAGHSAAAAGGLVVAPRRPRLAAVCFALGLGGCG
jgi:hypothetical protein